MELFKAHQQWSTRPKDEEFPSIAALHDACKSYASTAIERSGVPMADLRAEVIDGDVQLIGRKGIPARLTHWAFGQLSARASVPVDYARSIPATLAVQNLNHGLAHRVASDAAATQKLMFHENGSLLLRAITGDGYERIWNWEVTERLLDLQTKGWDVARPDIRTSVSSRLPLYASDHDLFAFLAHTDRVIKAPHGVELKRGLIVENSEVGASKIRLLRFLYAAMCGNHIIWGAEDVIELAFRHSKHVRDRLQGWDLEIKRYLDSSATLDESALAYAGTKQIAATKDGVLDALFGKRGLQLSRKALTAGYDAVQPAQDGDPRTVWGMVQGLTRYSQTVPYADERTSLDRAAGKVLSLAESF